MWCFARFDTICTIRKTLKTRLLKVTLFHGRFPCFFKLYKWYQIKHSVPHFFVTAWTITYSFVIIFITYIVENEWIISKWGNTRYNIWGARHTTHVFLIWRVRGVRVRSQTFPIQAWWQSCEMLLQYYFPKPFLLASQGIVFKFRF